MKNFFSFLSFFLPLLCLTSFSNAEIIPLEDYISEKKISFKNPKSIENGQEVLFYITSRCAGLWSAIDELPEFVDGKRIHKRRDMEKTYNQVIGDFTSGMKSIKKNYKSTLSEMTALYKKNLDEIFENTGNHMEGVVGKDITSCTNMYADIMKIDMDKVIDDIKQDTVITKKVEIDSSDLWQDLNSTFINVQVMSPDFNSDYGYMDQVISRYCISIHNSPVCPFIDASKYDFNEKRWNMLNETMISATSGANGTYLGRPVIEYVKHTYCVWTFNTTRCFEGQ